MLNLKAYTGKDIQNMLSILIQVSNKGLNIDNAISFLSDEMKNRRKVLTNNKETHIKYEKPEEVIPCKSCGKGNMIPIMNDEGLPILACNHCRYSFILKT
jgi:hypothetical protein